MAQLDPYKEQVFRKFIERAEDVAQSPFLKAVLVGELSVTFGVPPHTPVEIEIEGRTVSSAQPHGNPSSDPLSFDSIFHARLPDRHLYESFLLRIRRFLAQGDELHLDKIYNLADPVMQDGCTKTLVRLNRQSYRTLCNLPLSTFHFDGASLTPNRDVVVDLWLNGVIFHDNFEKEQKLQWNRFPDAFKDVLTVQFLLFCVIAARHIIGMRYLLKRAFRDGLWK